jgi:hypothetical protein
LYRLQEYNQVVLVGDAFDTRPYRLPWPEGTVIYLVAPADVHRAADAAAKALGARVPRGCLLRRVPAELHGEGGEGFAAALERAGLRGDRLSAWVLQVGGLQGLQGPVCMRCGLSHAVHAAQGKRGIGPKSHQRPSPPLTPTPFPPHTLHCCLG